MPLTDDYNNSMTMSWNNDEHLYSSFRDDNLFNRKL